MIGKLFQTIDRIKPTSHCDEIGACGPPETEISTQLTGVERKSVEDIACNICVDTVNQFKESLEDPKNVDQIRDGFKRLCHYLSKINEDQACNDLFNNYVDQMLQFVQHIDAKAYCTALTLCHKISTPMSTYIEKLLNLPLPTLDDFADFGLQKSVKLIGPINREAVDAMQPEMVINGEVQGLPCTLCKTVIKQILPLINENRTEESIESALREVCQLVYKNNDKRKECDDFVDRYSDEIVKILIDESAPELVCMMIELCTYQIPPKKVWSPVDRHILPAKTNALDTLFAQLDKTLNVTSETCLECKIFMHFIKEKLSNVKSVEELKSLLDTRICARITEQEVAKSCEKMVDEYAPKFFEVIVRNLNSEEVCEEIEMCKPKIDSHSQGAIVETKTDNYCDTCASTVAYIDKLLATQSVDKEISHLVDTICNNFPNANRNECRLIIDTFGPEILRAIGTMNNPNQLCRDLGLCHKSRNKHLLGAAKCSFGPGYWCQSSDHAQSCAAIDYCRRKVWKSLP